MLIERYKNEIIPALKKELDLQNPMSIPKVKKVVVNMGIAEAKEDKQLIEEYSSELAKITGQKPSICKAKRSISSFKLRQGEPIGLKVTLRGRRMYDFLERLFNLAFPRVRDFRGFSRKQLDKEGNYSIGITEQIVFPEIEIDKIKKSKGLQVTIVTNTTDPKAAVTLLKLMGLPFSDQNK